jgi:hypothetical protein
VTPNDEIPPPTEALSQRYARELLEILNELRVALPGVQILFGFMLVAPFSERFAKLSETAREIFFTGFLAVTVASALLIAPSVYHRLHWRREIADKERMLSVFTTLSIAGAVFLAVAITCVTFVVTDLLFLGPASLAVTGLVALLLLGLWFVLPLSRRAAAKKQHPVEPSGP